MVAWRLSLLTPECPEGRDIIVIANDLSYYMGSFGPQEDWVFYKASAYARELKIPRVSSGSFQLIDCVVANCSNISQLSLKHRSWLFFFW